MGIPKSTELALEDAIRPWMRDDAPGLAVGVRFREGWTWRAGAGLACVQSGIVNTPSTRMRVGSISKQFTCALVFMLAAEGKLDLSASARDLLPELPQLFARVTLRQLMNHTSGIWCHINSNSLVNGRAGSPVSDDEVMEMVCAQRELAFEPGERFLYSNGAFAILTRILERAAGKTLETLLTERLFDPIGMTSTGLHRNDSHLEPGLATLHMPRAAGGFSRGVFPASMGGEGGVVSTVPDLLRWLDHWDRPTAFDAAICTAVDEPVLLNNGYLQNFRYGMIRTRHRGLDVLYHDGGVAGGRARIAKIPSIGLDIVLLLNRGDVSQAELGDRIVDAVLGQPAFKTASVASGPAGRFHAPGQARVFDFATLDGRETVDTSGVPVPLVRAEEALICDTAETANMRFRLLEDLPDVIELQDCGASVRLRRLPKTFTPAPATLEEFAGDYVCLDTEVKLEFAVDGDAAWLQLDSPRRKQSLRLQPIAPDLWIQDPRTSVFGRVVVEAQRMGDRVTGLDVATFRVKLRFRRSGDTS